MPINITELGYAWTFVGVIIALGAVSVAFVQIINELTPLRSFLHAAWLRFWISERVTEYKEVIASKGVKSTQPAGQAGEQTAAPSEPANISAIPTVQPEHHQAQAFDMLVAAATGGHGLAFLGLPTNQLVGQINAAAQTVLENPIPYYPLLSVLAQPTLPKVRVFRGDKTELPTRTHLVDLNTICEFAKADQSTKDEMRGGYLECRARIGHAIQRNLDGIQITLTNRSSQTGLILSLGISFVLACLVFESPTVTNIVTVTAAGGYLATVLGDVFNALRRIGQR